MSDRPAKRRRQHNPFLAVRVVLKDDHGSTYSRDYSRGSMHLGKQAFVAFAVGDFIGLITEGRYSGMRVVSVEEIDFYTLAQNRRYQHTTH